MTSRKIQPDSKGSVSKLISDNEGEKLESRGDRWRVQVDSSPRSGSRGVGVWSADVGQPRVLAPFALTQTQVIWISVRVRLPMRGTLEILRGEGARTHPTLTRLFFLYFHRCTYNAAYYPARIINPIVHRETSTKNAATGRSIIESRPTFLAVPDDTAITTTLQTNGDN